MELAQGDRTRSGGQYDVWQAVFSPAGSDGYPKPIFDKAMGGSVAYGDRAEHCWNGDPKQGNAYSRLHYSFQYLPQILERIKVAAPRGADLKS